MRLRGDDDGGEEMRGECCGGVDVDDGGYEDKFLMKNGSREGRR